MKYSFHPEAKEEFMETIDYYELCSTVTRLIKCLRVIRR